ncbi:MAG: fluoride efflux transporter CrcB [Bacterioplanes sp.]|nr:fluoride efflux transporter CrcB [Bacterioplanes sp.]
MIWLSIAAGGALGAIARYGLSMFLTQRWPITYPIATLSINVIGSFFIGVAYVWLVQQEWGGAALKHLLVVGFLGAFTTFSTFSLETLLLLQQERWLAAMSYVSASVLVCIAGTALGIWISKSLV